VVMRETLEGALTELFGGPGGPRSQPAPSVATKEETADSGVSALVAEARRRYQAAIQAQRDIDWARYGEEFRRLGELLDQLGTGGSEPQR